MLNLIVNASVHREYLYLEPGYDFLYINNNAQSSISNKLVSIDQESIDMRFTSNYSISYYGGLQMTVMLGDYGKLPKKVDFLLFVDDEYKISALRSLENARIPKSLKNKNADSQSAIKDKKLKNCLNMFDFESFFKNQTKILPF